ncbi:MAG: ATP-binding protein [bacterium]
MYIERDVKKRIQVLSKGFPVITITGPRQSGKTTFLQHNYPKYKYFNLEDPITLRTIKDDPVTFFNQNPSQIIIDEVQRFPELLSHIQVLVDKKQEMGSIFLSGSQNLLVSEKISQTLAGRSAYQTILPLSLGELKKGDLLYQNRLKQMLKGGYPSLYTRQVTSKDYFKQYISTYTERDVRQIRNISDLSQFQQFMILLAGRAGQLLNTSSLANDIGVSPNTIEDWISILEASYIVFRLQPYFENIGKRLIKSPKLYFYDIGLLTTLLNIQDAEQLQSHYLFGNIFENFIISEFQKEINNSYNSVKAYFYRDTNGNEVDLILDIGSKQIPVEIKSSASYSSDFSKGIEYWNKNIGKQSGGYIIYGDDKKLQVNGIEFLPWNQIKDVLKNLNKE